MRRWRLYFFIIIPLLFAGIIAIGGVILFGDKGTPKQSETTQTAKKSNNREVQIVTQPKKEIPNVLNPPEVTSVQHKEDSEVSEEELEAFLDSISDEELKAFFDSIFETSEKQVASIESKTEAAKNLGYTIVRQEGENTIVRLGNGVERAVPTNMLDDYLVTFTIVTFDDGTRLIVPYGVPTEVYRPTRIFDPPPEVKAREKEIRRRVKKFALELRRKGIDFDNLQIPEELPPEYQELYWDVKAIEEDPSNWSVQMTRGTITIGEGPLQ